MAKFLRSFIKEEEAPKFTKLGNDVDHTIWYSFIYCKICDKMNCFRIEDFEYDDAQDLNTGEPVAYECTCGVKVLGEEIPGYHTRFDLEDKYDFKNGKASYIKQVANYHFDYDHDAFDKNIVDEIVTQRGVTFTNSGIFWVYNKIKNGKTIENKVYDVTFKDIKPVYEFLGDQASRVISEWIPGTLNIDLTHYEQPTLHHLQQVLQARKKPLFTDLKVIAYNSTATYDSQNLLLDKKPNNENNNLYVTLNKAQNCKDLLNTIISKPEFRTKSVKKALYRLSHEKGLVSPTDVHLLSQVCIDVNVLPKLIEMYGSTVSKNHEVDAIFLRNLAKDFYNLRGCTTHFQVLVMFLDVLLVSDFIGVNEKAKSFNAKCGIGGVGDTIRQVKELKNNSEVEFYQEVLKKYKPEMSLADFHDLVSEIYNTYREFVRMQPYSENLVWEDLEGTYEDYKFESARSSQDLVNWGKELSHCVASYSDNILRGDTNIFAIYDPKGKLLVNVEVLVDKEIEDPKTEEIVRTYYISQARGKCNRSVECIEDENLHKAFMMWSKDKELDIRGGIRFSDQNLYKVAV